MYKIVRSSGELVFSYLSEYFVKVWFGPNLINAITEVECLKIVYFKVFQIRNVKDMKSKENLGSKIETDQSYPIIIILQESQIISEAK